MGILSLDEFKQPTFLGYVENALNTKRYLLKEISDTDVTYDLTFDYEVFTQTYAPTASITGWNSGAPLRDKEGFKVVTQEVAKIQHGIRIDEREQLKFMNPRTDGERNQAIKRVYDQTDRLIVGVDDTEEYLRAQAVYVGTIAYNDTKNNVKVEVSFGLNPIVPVTTPWTDRVDATPLDDLLVALQAYKDANAGQSPRYIDMSGAVLMDLRQNDAIRGAVFGVNSAKIASREEVQAQINALADTTIEIRVQDEVVLLDTTGQVTRLLPTRTVALLGAQPIITVEGPTIEKNFEPGIYVVTKEDMGPPPQDEIYVGKSAFVAVRKPSEIYRLSV